MVLVIFVLNQKSLTYWLALQESLELPCTASAWELCLNTHGRQIKREDQLFHRELGNAISYPGFSIGNPSLARQSVSQSALGSQPALFIAAGRSFSRQRVAYPYADTILFRSKT